MHPQQVLMVSSFAHTLPLGHYTEFLQKISATVVLLFSKDVNHEVEI